MREIGMRLNLLALGLCVLAAPSLAVDTWEPYPAGPATLEFYAARYGHGAENDSLSGYSVCGGPAWGLTPTTHVYLFTGISSTDVQTGGIDFLTLGLFANLRDGRAFDLDAYAQLGAAGEGLGMASRLVGLEYNMDLKRWGLFARTAWEWVNDGADEGGDAVVGRTGLFTWGTYLKPTPTVQILGELTQEAPSGFESIANESRITSWALGYNRLITKNMELILEARIWEPADDDGERTWDFTVGAVTVW